MSLKSNGSPASQDPYWWRAAPRRGRAGAAVAQGCRCGDRRLGLHRHGGRRFTWRGRASCAGARSWRAWRRRQRAQCRLCRRTLKHSFGDIMESEGLERAIVVYREMRQAFDCVFETVEAEGIDCRLRRQGRFMMAVTPASMRGWRGSSSCARRISARSSRCSAATRREARSTRSAITAAPSSPIMAGFIPGSIIRACSSGRRSAGADTWTNAGHRHHRRRRPLRGRDQAWHGAGARRAIATNGYTSGLMPWLDRRVIPFDGYDRDRAVAGRAGGKLLPGGRTFVDWNFNVDFVRRAPDDPRRILFGGLTGARADLPAMAERLKARLVRIFRRWRTRASTMCGPGAAPGRSTCIRISAAIEEFTMRSAIALPACRWAPGSASRRRIASSGATIRPRSSPTGRSDTSAL